MTYTYYVATVSRCVILAASNAREALEAAECDPKLNGRPILTVRIATKAEIEMHDWHQARAEELRRHSERKQPD